MRNRNRDEFLRNKFANREDKQAHELQKQGLMTTAAEQAARANFARQKELNTQQAFQGQQLAQTTGGFDLKRQGVVNEGNLATQGLRNTGAMAEQGLRNEGAMSVAKLGANTQKLGLGAGLLEKGFSGEQANTVFNESSVPFTNVPALAPKGDYGLAPAQKIEDRQGNETLYPARTYNKATGAFTPTDATSDIPTAAATYKRQILSITNDKEREAAWAELLRSQPEVFKYLENM